VGLRLKATSQWGPSPEDVNSLMAATAGTAFARLARKVSGPYKNALRGPALSLPAPEG
jgi:hypothetical protein